jgi:hypothetical protein
VDQLPLKTYLAADDILFSYPLQFWSLHSDPILADLSRRFLDRDLLKARNISRLSAADQKALHSRLSQVFLRKGWDPCSYLGVRSAHTKGYTLYYQGISLNTEEGLKEIADLSPLVQALTQSQEQTWLIFPRELSDSVEEALTHR